MKDQVQIYSSFNNQIFHIYRNNSKDQICDKEVKITKMLPNISSDSRKD